MSEEFECLGVVGSIVVFHKVRKKFACRRCAVTEAPVRK